MTMEHTIKLTKKQLELISGTQKQKAELTKAFHEINNKEAAVVELILESAGYTDQPSQIRFENEALVISFPEVEKKAKTKAKRSKKVVYEESGNYDQG